MSIVQQQKKKSTKLPPGVKQIIYSFVRWRDAINISQLNSVERGLIRDSEIARVGKNAEFKHHSHDTDDSLNRFKRQLNTLLPLIDTLEI